MILCGSFHITPEKGQGPGPIVLVSVQVPVPAEVPFSVNIPLSFCGKDMFIALLPVINGKGEQKNSLYLKVIDPLRLIYSKRQ